MPFVAIPTTVKLVIRGTADNQVVNNVLHYKYVGTAPTSAQLITFINSWITNNQSLWLAVHGPNYALIGVDATDLSSASGAFATVTVAGPSNVGTQTGATLPNNVALAVSWRTGLVGRRNRGRSFLGGFSASAVAGDIASNAMLTAVNSLALALIGQTYTGGYDFAIASRKDAVARIITGFVLESILDSMRRRLPARGV